MRVTFGDVNARARGIQSHLLSLPELQELARMGNPAALDAALQRRGYPIAPDHLASAADRDQLIGQVAAARLNLLAHWLGSRQPVLRMVLERRDLVALRAIVRGLAEGASGAARLRGVHPSPLLPAPLLAKLATATSTPGVHRVLHRAHHPAAELFAAPAGGADRRDLLDLETSLCQWWARRVEAGARGAGRAIRLLAGEVIDGRNLESLLLVAGWGLEIDPATVFLPGGQRLERSRFLALAGILDGEDRRMALAATFKGTLTGVVLADSGVPMAAIGRRLRAAAIGRARRTGRLDPLGPAPIVEVVLRIEAEAEDLRRVVHGMALEAPATLAATGVLAAA